jgi:hypothetical protein
MSNEWKPLLSDEAMAKIGLNVCEDDGAHITGNAVRDFYEQLITDRKLRVVEEVELVLHYDPCKEETSPNRTPSLVTCSGCHTPMYYLPYAYCPGCGNKIKNA